MARRDAGTGIDPEVMRSPAVVRVERGSIDLLMEGNSVKPVPMSATSLFGPSPSSEALQRLALLGMT